MGMLRPPLVENQQIREGRYVSDYGRWKGFYNEVPVLKSIIDANADAVTAGWATKGPSRKDLSDILKDMRGNGKQTFKIMMSNAVKVCKIGGDAYFEKLDGGEDLIMLPADSVTQIIENGRIKRYEQFDPKGTLITFKPDEILHFAYNSVGAMTHGQSSIEPMNNILLSLRQVQDDMRLIYEKYASPTRVVEIDALDATERSDIINSLKQAFKLKNSSVFVDKDRVKITAASIPQYSTLDPANWHRILMDQIIMSSRVPELALGTGSVNSEESAKMQFDGFRQMVRFDQEFMEETLESQLFPDLVNDDTSIEFSFAAEPQEEKYTRLLNTLTSIDQLAINDEIKSALMAKIITDMGFVDE